MCCSLQKLIPHHEVREDGTFVCAYSMPSGCTLNYRFCIAQAFISEDQWKRFDSYAQRVRTWGFHSVKIDTSFISTLQQFAQALSLFLPARIATIRTYRATSIFVFPLPPLSPHKLQLLEKQWSTLWRAISIHCHRPSTYLEALKLRDTCR